MMPEIVLSLAIATIGWSDVMTTPLFVPFKLAAVPEMKETVAGLENKRLKVKLVPGAVVARF